MRRSSVAVVTLALMASALIAGSPASAEPYEGPQTGALSSKQAVFTVGEDIELLANFPSDQASKVVTFLKETSPGSNDYASLGTRTANSSGNAYFKPLTVSAEQEVFARAPDGEVTQLLTLTPQVAHPDNFTVGGTLSMSPTTVAKGGTVSIVANFPDGTFKVTLYEESGPGVWTAVGYQDEHLLGRRDLHRLRGDGRDAAGVRAARPTASAPRSTSSSRRPR